MERVGHRDRHGLGGDAAHGADGRQNGGLSATTELLPEVMNNRRGHCLPNCSTNAAPRRGQSQALKDKNVPVPEITKKLTIKTGKNAGTNPLVASLYRALTEAEQEEAAGQARVGEQRRPVPARATGP
ncbi:hypothetical protein [Streptomyces peucetius]|uniref:Uncharacterized protein n=1 Tax=Streptomyces peucetius TaxID=1950 RepID=A0ABY6IM81_STRPE|nr:hypothetical protein [Streptomyces peucetius]UYQ66805.1 hypothetical protein OGH68_03785 [Streptomyces peucetius]